MGWIADSEPYLTPPPPGERDAWTQQTAGRGTQEILAAEAVAATEDVAAALGLPVGAPAMRRVRLMRFDGESVELVTSHYPTERLPREAAVLGEARPIKGGTVRLLADLGWTAARRVEDVSAETAADHGAPGVGPHTAALVTRRTLFTAAGVPFEYTVMVAWDGRRQRYTLRAE